MSVAKLLAQSAVRDHMRDTWHVTITGEMMHRLDDWQAQEEARHYQLQQDLHDTRQSLSEMISDMQHERRRRVEEGVRMRYQAEQLQGATAFIFLVAGILLTVAGAGLGMAL